MAQGRVLGDATLLVAITCMTIAANKGFVVVSRMHHQFDEAARSALEPAREEGRIIAIRWVGNPCQPVIAGESRLRLPSS